LKGFNDMDIVDALQEYLDKTNLGNNLLLDDLLCSSRDVIKELREAGQGELGGNQDGVVIDIKTAFALAHPNMFRPEPVYGCKACNRQVVLESDDYCPKCGVKITWVGKS